ncbi:MAG: hypothetical protein QG674_281 [Patescibacteria group bacterium]|jgi:hypothetical protein|nr:hypothetical protein [Patescibacteria group bacterium]
MKRFFYIFLATFFILIGTTYSQALPLDISISTIPTEPKPGQTVSARVESFGMDLNSSNISWFYNGKNIGSGLGKTSVSFIAPNSSSVAELSVSATGSAGSAQASLTIRSASVDVIWEAIDSYVPPFYKGKALAPVGGRIKVTAVPSITAPKSLSYYWKYNGNAVPGQSGTNKNSLTIKTDVLSGNENFSVDTRGGSFSGSGSTGVTLREPETLVYQKINGFIDYSKGSTRDVYISAPGVTLRTEPFNFSITNNVNNSLSIGFILGEESFVGTTNSQELSITNPGSGGESTFVVNTTSLRERLQQTRRSFILHF